MSDYIEKYADRVNSTHPVNVGSRTPAPRRDPAGSNGAFDPVGSVSQGNTVPRAPRPTHGDFIENSMDPTGSTHVHDHIMHGATPPDVGYGVKHASTSMPRKGRALPFNTGDGPGAQSHPAGTRGVGGGDGGHGPSDVDGFGY
jgi:hypothetical protein